MCMKKLDEWWDDLPRWKRGPLSVFRGADGAYSSKRVAGFSSIAAAFYATYIQADPMIVAIWLAFAAGLWGFSLGEAGAPSMSLSKQTSDETSERITREIGNGQ